MFTSIVGNVFGFKALHLYVWRIYEFPLLIQKLSKVCLTVSKLKGISWTSMTVLYWDVLLNQNWDYPQKITIESVMSVYAVGTWNLIQKKDIVKIKEIPLSEYPLI
jgi:hypothetical protein